MAVDLTEKRIKTLQYAEQNNGITLTEAAENIYRHKSTASNALQTLTQERLLKIQDDTPIIASYNKIWILTKKGKMLVETLQT